MLTRFVGSLLTAGFSGTRVYDSVLMRYDNRGLK